MIVWSVAGFFIGVIVTLAIVWTFGGMTYVGLKIILQGKAAFEHAQILSEEVSMAQAAMWDRIGFPEAAGSLVLMATKGTSDPMQFLVSTNQEKERLLAKYEKFVFQGNLIFPLPDVMVCGIHGESRWQEHYECLRCHRVFDQEAPEICPCGYRLFPVKDYPLDYVSSAKTICRHCYKDRLKDNDTKPVGDPIPELPLDMTPAMVTWGQCPQCEATAYLKYGPNSERPLLRYALAQCPVCGHEEKTEEQEST